MTNPWGKNGIHDDVSFELEHLKDIKKTYTSPDRTYAYPTTIKFHFHCFTDHVHHAGEHRTKFVDEEFPDEERVFCPHRWWLSLILPRIVDNIGNKRLIESGGGQWLYVHRLLNISSPYAIFFKFNPGAPGSDLVVRITSAYVKKDFKKHGREVRFDLLLSEANTGKIPGK